MFARNVGIPLDPRTRATKGGGEIPRPSVRRKTGILFGFCLRRNRKGLCFSIANGQWEKSIYLKKYPMPPLAQAPREAFPSILTEMPTGRVYEPEDIEHGEPEPIKLIEPEDM